MRDFWDELRIIPRMVWPLALLFTAGVFGLFIEMRRRLGPMTHGEIALFIWGALIFFSWVILIVYINVDARRRGMRHVMWTLLTIFIPYFIGAILYFVLRDPLLIACPKCGAKGRSAFVFCPQCGAGLSPSCPACKRSVMPEWQLCAYCGTVLQEEKSDQLCRP